MGKYFQAVLYLQKMANLILRGVQQTRSQALDLPRKNERLSSPPSSKNLHEDNNSTTEHSWRKTVLSKGGRRKLFNPGLMNKSIRME